MSFSHCEDLRALAILGRGQAVEAEGSGKTVVGDAQGACKVNFRRYVNMPGLEMM